MLIPHASKANSLRNIMTYLQPLRTKLTASSLLMIHRGNGTVTSIKPLLPKSIDKSTIGTLSFAQKLVEIARQRTIQSAPMLLVYDTRAMFLCLSVVLQRLRCMVRNIDC